MSFALHNSYLKIIENPSCVGLFSQLIKGIPDNSGLLIIVDDYHYYTSFVLLVDHHNAFLISF